MTTSTSTAPKRKVAGIPHADIIAVIALTLLWMLFFWRALTPTPADQASLVAGDFSSQFFTFGAYQYDRLASGEIPLWNPYNNAGLPFVADTQSAAFYPPRLLTITLSAVFGDGWTYNSLQLEVILHLLAYSLFMYAFVRRLIRAQPWISASSGFAAAIISAYGGFMTGYPPLQLAILESATWLPLALLGILEATRGEKPFWSWLGLTGMALGLGWMAGHPQTAWFSTYLIIAYWTYRLYLSRGRINVRFWLTGGIIIGMVTAGIYAVQLLPGLEYLSQTARSGLSFDEKGGGFPYQDIAQLLFPGVMSLWSPLFVGVTGLALAILGLTGIMRERVFWGLVALAALVFSFGANSALFHAAYNFLPGLNFFRGQERAAFVFSLSLSVLAGLGVHALLLHEHENFAQRVRRGAAALLTLCASAFGALFIIWPGNPEAYESILNAAAFSSFIALLLGMTAVAVLCNPRPAITILLLALITFELFSINIDNTSWEPIPATNRPIMFTPPLVERVQQDDDLPFRIDAGFGGMYDHGNAGSRYNIAEMRGISPLFLEGPHAIIQRESPVEAAWEIFAVRYVFTDAEELRIPSEIIARDYPTQAVYNLHRLDDARPFAHLAYDYVLVEDDAAARELLHDVDFDLRTTIILDREPGIDLSSESPEETESGAEIIEYAPERFTVTVTTSTPAILSLSHVDYPGWRAQSQEGEYLEILRAYGSLTAIALPPGEHTITFSYRPLMFTIGAVLSLLTWVGLGILVITLWVRSRRRHAGG